MNKLEWTSKKVRKVFLEYFKSKEHVFITSSPVVPHDDPTLLFANAGMNQFKPIFLGVADPDTQLGKLKRAHNSQKCIRAGGKHNDLDDVGRDVYHHTFFEMLGNWSFGDYFKDEAIYWAYDLLVNVYGLDKDRLYATYFGGDKEKGLEPDNEARDIWKKYLPENRILPFDMKDNFWEMGNTGPCGPCTEIHYDRIGNRDASKLVNQDDPNVLEIWNVVFMEFNREDDGSLRLLPAKSVDTGMGFERLVSVLQNKTSNYDTDIFMPIFERIHKTTGVRKYQGLVGNDDVELIDTAYRVVADHIRTLTIAITDGATPDTHGRGYVLRRILRRGVRYFNQFLNPNKVPNVTFSSLYTTVVEILKDQFPELDTVHNKKNVEDTLISEEKAFARTLDNGVKQFNKLTTNMKAGDMISGRDAATLYETYGFPIDLTIRMAEEKGLLVDENAFHIRMEELKELSRQNANQNNEYAMKLRAEDTAKLEDDMKISPTETDIKYDWITTGENCKTHSGKLLAIYTSNKEFVSHADSKEDLVYGLVLDRSSFYAEAGGQVGDTGIISSNDDENTFIVRDTQNFGKYVLHIGSMNHGKLNINDDVELKVDYDRRSLIAKNHTATHLLNFALRDVIGKETDQKGSIVEPEKLRFDFGLNKKMPINDIIKAQTIVQNIVEKNLIMYREPLPLDEASKINGLRAVFGEKYPDPVRVVSAGIKIEDMRNDPSNDEWTKTSVEFCGGTHLDTTGEAKPFVLISEEGISKGVRRIVAFTAERARRAIVEGERFLNQLNEAFELPDDEKLSVEKDFKKRAAELITSVNLKDEAIKKMKQFSKLCRDISKKRYKKIQNDVIDNVTNIMNDTIEKKENFIIFKLRAGLNGNLLRDAVKAAEKISDKIPVLFISATVDNVNGIANVPKSLSETFDSTKWLEKVLVTCGGRCGGKKGCSQGSAKSISKLDEGIEAARKYAETNL